MNSFEQSLVANMGTFDLDLPAETVTRLGEYYSLLTRWNDRLHLVAPCSEEEFAVRHVLESLMLLKYLTPNARVADVGSGGGLPIIPCLIARPDIHATLIESSLKKSVFLREASTQLHLNTTIIARRFEEIEAPPVDFVTCRALDQFMQKLPALIDWAPKGSKLLLFGGESLRNMNFEEILIPKSERRFLFVATD